MVLDAQFTSYYGKPILNPPVWSVPDIPAYLYLGGLAGGSSLMAVTAAATGQPGLARVARVGAASGGVLSLVALVHDLGRPARFLNMMRVFKVTSPMSVGSWTLAGYAPAAVVAAGCDLAGRFAPVKVAATVGAALLAPVIATYTAALISDTAVPAWHDGYREMPYLFAGSSAMAAGGLGLACVPAAQRRLPRSIGVLGAATELAASQLMEHRLGMVAEPYKRGRSGRLTRAGQILGLAAAAGSLYPGTVIGRVAGAGLMVASALTRFGIFDAGMASARDPKYTVTPQRQRLDGSAAGAE